MKNEFIKQCYKSDLNYTVHYVYGKNTDRAYNDKLHYDTDLTIAYFKEMTGNIKIEGNTYDLASGDIIILNYDELHCVNIKSEFCERIILYLNESIYKKYNQELNNLFEIFYNRKHGEDNLIRAKTVKEKGLDVLMGEIYEYSAWQNSVGELIALGKITQLLSKLKSKEFEYSESCCTNNSIIDKVLKYISLHFTEELSCDSIAEQMHLSKYYLNRLFKETVGISIWNYIINRRILYFNELVRQNNYIENACIQAGFNNYSNFYRIYKKRTGISPQEFKRSITKNTAS